MPDYYAFPNTIYDQPENLLAVLGSWWSRDYESLNQAASLVYGKSQVEQQTMLDLMELLASLSRFSVPIYHRDNWYPLYLRQNQRNTATVALPKYDAGITYQNGGGASYDVVDSAVNHAYPLPPKMVSAPLLMNRFTDPTWLITEGVDYVIDNNTIVFRIDPFTDARVARRPVYQDGVPVDTEAIIWVYRGQWDWEYIYSQFAYVLGTRLQSSPDYRNLMNAVFDALIGGTTVTDIRLALSAMTGVPLVRETTETIEDIVSDGVERIVITDQHVYKFGVAATVIVAAGDRVVRGQSLTDALQIYELNRGQVPAALGALALGRGFLATCFYSDLIFENREVPLVVDSNHVSGCTKVTFDLGGFPLDVERFFNDLHNRGCIEAQLPVDDCDEVQTISYPANDCEGVGYLGRRGTLAHLLDQRQIRVGEPTAFNLPRTINPLRFLIQNVLRNNAYIVRIKAATTGQTGVGLQNVKLLRKVVPPHTAMFLIVDMTALDDSVTLTNFEEQVSTFTGMTPLLDDIPASSLINDLGPRIRVVSGTCF